MVNKNIFCTVDEKHLKQFGDRERLIIELQTNKGIFLTAKTLAKRCGFRSTETQVELRKTISELITEHNLPIIANSTGFSWATDKNQILFYINQLETRKQGIERRQKALAKIYDNQNQNEKLL